MEAWPYSDVHVLKQLWQRLGIAEVITQTLGQRKSGFPLERALFAMIANRACVPSSKLYCYEQWLIKDVRIAGTETLELHHLYRAMDFLKANKEAIEQAIFPGGRPCSTPMSSSSSAIFTTTVLPVS